VSEYDDSSCPTRGERRVNQAMVRVLSLNSSFQDSERNVKSSVEYRNNLCMILGSCMYLLTNRRSEWW